MHRRCFYFYSGNGTFHTSSQPESTLFQHKGKRRNTSGVWILTPDGLLNHFFHCSGITHAPLIRQAALGDCPDSACDDA